MPRRALKPSPAVTRYIIRIMSRIYAREQVNKPPRQATNAAARGAVYRYSIYYITNHTCSTPTPRAPKVSEPNKKIRKAGVSTPNKNKRIKKKPVNYKKEGKRGQERGFKK